MKKLNYIFLILGLILCIVPFFLPFYSLFRLISLLLGIILIVIGLVVYMPYKLAKIIILPIAFMASFYTLDYFSFKIFSTIPIFVSKSHINKEVNIYNSLFYRVYVCDNQIISDENYEKPFACDTGSLEEHNINELLTNSKESFKEYKGKFIKVIGKINTIKGNSSLTLNAYDYGEETLNGYVVFDENKKIVINDIKIDPNKYHIYDYVEVVGLVSSYSEDGEVMLELKDAKIIDNDIYESYELVTNNIDKPDVTKATDNVYYVGISGIYYRYSQSDIYELSYLLSDKRETIDNLVKNSEPVILKDDNKLYMLPEFKILVCKKDNIYFLNNNITNYNDLCK